VPLEVQNTVYKKYFNRILSGAIIIACVLLVLALIQRYHFASRRSNRTVSLNGVDFSHSKKTLLLFFQRDCDICRASLPFYRSLLKEFPVRTSAQFVFITPEAPTIVERFLKEEGISSVTVFEGRAGLLGVKNAPTLILADSDAAVRGYWVGQLTPEQEAEIHKGLGN
jgi:thiol-disulfide isomerase/thioredoxin